MEYNQIGRNSIDKVRERKRHPIKPLRSQTVELACAFPFTEKDYIRVALRSPHVTQDVKTSGPLYLSRIFSYKLVVENSNAYRSSCEGTMTVKLITPPCAHINGKVLLYKDPTGGAVSAEGGKALRGFEEPASSQLAFKWLTQGENETEFNCSVFDPGRNKYCFRFVFNFSRSPSPAQTCLVVHRSPSENVILFFLAKEYDDALFYPNSATQLQSVRLPLWRTPDTVDPSNNKTVTVLKRNLPIYVWLQIICIIYQ